MLTERMTVEEMSKKYPNEWLFIIKDDPFVDNNQQLSHEEFKALLEALADISKKFTRPDTKSLSDYAVSREGIYEGHPNYDLSD